MSKRLIAYTAQERAVIFADSILPSRPSWFRPEEIAWDSPLIRHVLEAMPEDTHLVEAVGFLLTAQPDLELEDGSACRPVDWLAQGRDPKPVLTIASGLRSPI